MNNHEMIGNEYLNERLLNALNEQGFLFQEICRRNLEKHAFGWSVRTAEYPVSLKNQDTRIDLILKANSQPERFVIVECKRSDPNYQCWLFSASKTDYLYSPECFVLCLESGPLISSDTTFQLKGTVKRFEVDVPTYTARDWLEVQIKPKINNRVSSTSVIEHAFAQVLTGVSGYAQEQIQQRKKSPSPTCVYFIPVVVTTASLYTAAYCADDINLSTGKIEKSKVVFGANDLKLEERSWILVHYGASETLSPSLIPENFYDNDPRELMKHKQRSIFVVNSNHIIDFFKNLV